MRDATHPRSQLLTSRFLFEANHALSSRNTVASKDCTHLFVGGFCDNAVRVVHAASRKCVALGTAHRAPVTCLAIDVGGEMLVSGSRDRTCVLWDIYSDGSVGFGGSSSQGGGAGTGVGGGGGGGGGGASDCPQLEQRHIYFGHSMDVTAVAVSAEFDLVVSASLDGTVNLHTVRKAEYIKTLSLDAAVPPELSARHSTVTADTM